MTIRGESIRNLLKFGGLVALLLGTVLLAAQAPRDPAAKKKGKGPDPGWIALFNGKNLDGWVKVGDEMWEVDSDGAIHGKGVTKNYGYLRTEGRVHLRVDASGKYFRSG